nr:spry domain protein [uncultured Mediterranean phage uvMED]
MASSYLSRASGTPTSTKKFTISFWFKKCRQGADSFLVSSFTDASNRMQVNLNSDDTIDFVCKVSGSNVIRKKPSRLLRDPSAFYHVTVAVDTTLGTASDRCKFYINGSQENSFASETNPSQNADVNVSGDHFIGAYDNGGSPALFFDGLMTHIHYTDGYTYQASTFGESDSTSGIWKPKTAPSVTYGTNGFFLKFENSGAMGTDSSGNSNTFTVGGTLTQNVDTPSNNFATLNPIHTGGGALSAHANGFGNGNLYNGDQSPNYWQSVPATIGLTSGKWYWELKDESDWGSTSDSTRRYGICDYDSIVSTLGSGADVRFSGDTSAYAYMNESGVRHNGSTISGSASTHPTFAEGDFIMVAMDLDNNKLYFGKNGTWLDSGNPASGASGTGAVATISATATWSPYIETKYGSDNVSLNFGQGYFRTTSAGTNSDSAGIGKFKYTVPSGYYSICTNNIKNYG